MKPCHLVVGVTLALVPAAVAAQSLADAARRAEEARKGSGGVSRIFTNKDLKTIPGDEERIASYELTLENLTTMMNASRMLSRLGDPELGHRLQVRIEAANSLDELVAVFETEPVIAKTIAAAGMSPRDFLMTGTALNVALAILERRTEPPPGPLPPAVQKNLEFVRTHRAIIQAYQEEKRARGLQE